MKYKIVLFSLFFIIISCGDNRHTEKDSGLELSKVMGDSGQNEFSRAEKPIDFVFPEDHGPHNDFRTEWWYLTGNISSEEGRKFGYQFTIFRTGMTKNKVGRESNWNSNQIYMGHFAFTDIDEGEFYFDERFSREGNKLAGAVSEPFRVWIEDWQIEQIGDSIFFDLPKLNITARFGDIKIDFILQSAKPYILQGDKGLSQKGKEPGNASYYYSYTRLNTEGSIYLKGEKYNIAGYSWMDREWSTSALDSNQAGWDWFSLQLSDNTEIMYYQMRKNDGTADIFSKGIIVDEEGNSELLKKNDVELNVLDYWISPEGSKYPSGWELKILQKGIELKIIPNLTNQLMKVTITYWEGSVSIEGSVEGKPLTGKGYVELTGY